MEYIYSISLKNMTEKNGRQVLAIIWRGKKCRAIKIRKSEGERGYFTFGSQQIKNPNKVSFSKVWDVGEHKKG